MGSREGVAAKIDTATKEKIAQMNEMVKKKEEHVCILMYYILVLGHHWVLWAYAQGLLRILEGLVPGKASQRS